ncbi:MAG: hypothetical protein H6978_16435 [Gammaproteobacteria bacterium]|nr:hypothetical protein [Gammaproteobacteria bacterium]
METIVRAFPLKKSVEDLEAFVESLRAEWKESAAKFYRGYGVAQESWHLQETNAGPWVICVTVIDDSAQAAANYAKSTEKFQSWFKEKVHSLSGINPDEQPLGPQTRQIFSWPE